MMALAADTHPRSAGQLDHVLRAHYHITVTKLGGQYVLQKDGRTSKPITKHIDALSFERWHARAQEFLHGGC